MVTDNTNQADDTTAFLRAARSGNLEKIIEYLDTDLDINTANSNGLNALHLASKDGHVEIVTELLKRGAKVDAATKKGNTALHIASLAGQAEIVNILIQYGAAVNIQSQNGFTPLYMAAQENHDQVVKLLLSNGANQSLATEDGFTPLAVAMQQGHDKVVSVLLENDSKGKVRLPALHIAAKKDDCKAADLLLQNDHKPDVTSKSGFTPLHIAAHYGNEEIARLLIKRGADVNYLAKHNISPLHVAAKWGKNNIVKILLENSAQIDAKTRDGLTPLHCAARSGHEEVVNTLLENSAPISARSKNGLAPLHMASQGDHVDAARALLYHRAPVDEVTIDYLTSLHVAAHCGHVRVAKLLLDRKADPNARALNGFTPLHIACKKNRIKVVELLLKHGASIESTTESGLTPLHVASFMGCMNIVIFLLQHEANPDVPTVRGETPLHLAARANQTDIIRILLRNGAKVDARAREQQTPLHIASRLGNIDIVMLLLQHGAAVDTTTKDMHTALHIAAKEGQEEVAAILVENNASVKATTKNGFTPLHIAAKYGNMNVAKILLQKDSKLDAQGKNDITPLHLACHYDHPNVANLLLEKGASPHLASQNGHTPLHIAARKNQMDIASTLLEGGANANAESKAGFTPLHLSSQKGHYDMTNLLIEHGADPNHKAKNGLTALHLCAQEDFVRVASILVKNDANVESQTETGYRPIHVAAHFGNLSMIRFLLKHSAEIDVRTGQNYTPLHQAAQQGHAHVVSALLEGNASHKARTNDGLTALNIAQKLGYISVMEVLKGMPYDNLAPDNKNWEEKYKVIAPESLQETSLMSDSDDEGASDALISEQPYKYLTADLMKSLRDDSLPIDVTKDDPIHRQITKEEKQEFVQSNNYCLAENFDSNDALNLGRLHFRSFLVSFLVDARGGAMKGCRHSGVRIIVPPRRATMPLRVTCRLVKPSKVANPPPLMEGEALATRIIEMGPVGATFLGPVLIDIPHFASIRGKEREIIILRSENGETWKEHDNSIDNDDTLLNTPHDPQMNAAHSGRITRIITTDFPQYFAIVTRIKQEVHVIGSEGGILMSSVANDVQAVFPPGALTKKIKVGLQAHVIPAELTAKLLGNCVAVSPVITIEPRRRKFHKPITLTIPVPQAANKGMINQYGGETPTLRLLCSIAGGTSEAQWEDVTGSTPLTFMNDRVSFTTTVSARFWLMDCRNISEVPKMATELYKESLFVPYITNFVIYSKRMDTLEATLRILCMTDGKEGMHTLERQEEFLEIVKSRDVEALHGKDLYIEFSGNLTPITKSGVQLKFTFKAFRQNRLSFHVKVKDPLLDPVARMLFMREPKVAKGEPPQQPICVLNIVLPEVTTKIEIQKKLTAYEDSNIISQKMDFYKSKYGMEQKEKGDQPKDTSPSEEKFIADTLQKEQTDAATIHESFAQKAASCPLESVDASYPTKKQISGQQEKEKEEKEEEKEEGEEEGEEEVAVTDYDLSPGIEKQTYSEKRKFWEDISKKRESYQRSESEVSRTSQLTVNESDSEYMQNVVSEEEITEVTSVGSDTMENVNVPDISECSVAEKAHYFEEQIQKELSKVPAVKLTQSQQQTQDAIKLEKDVKGKVKQADKIVEVRVEVKHEGKELKSSHVEEKDEDESDELRKKEFQIEQEEWGGGEVIRKVRVDEFVKKEYDGRLIVGLDKRVELVREVVGEKREEGRREDEKREGGDIRKRAVELEKKLEEEEVKRREAEFRKKRKKEEEDEEAKRKEAELRRKQEEEEEVKKKKEAEEEEAKRKEVELKKKQEEEEAKKKKEAEEEAKRKEAELKKKQEEEEEAKRKAAELKKKQEEEEEEAKRKAAELKKKQEEEEEAKRKAAELKKKQEEEEAKKKKEAEEEEAKRKAAELKKKQEEEEEAKRKEAELKKKQEEEEARKKKEAEEEEEAKRKAAELKKKQEEEEAKKKKEAEEEAKRKAAELKKKQEEEEEAKRKAAELKKKQEEEEAKKKKEAEEEAKRKAAELKKKQEEEEAERKAAELKKKQEEEAERKAAELKKKQEEKEAELKKREEIEIEKGSYEKLEKEMYDDVKLVQILPEQLEKSIEEAREIHQQELPEHMDRFVEKHELELQKEYLMGQAEASMGSPKKISMDILSKERESQLQSHSKQFEQMEDVSSLSQDRSLGKDVSTGRRVIKEETTIIWKVQEDGSLVQEKVTKTVQIEGDEDEVPVTTEIINVPETSLEPKVLYEERYIPTNIDDKFTREDTKLETREKQVTYVSEVQKEKTDDDDDDEDDLRKDKSELEKISQQKIMIEGDTKIIRKEFESRIPVSMAKVEKDRNHKDMKSKISIESKRTIDNKIELDKQSMIVHQQEDYGVTSPVDKKKEFESRIPKRIVDTSSTIKSEKDMKKGYHVKTETETCTVTEKKSSSQETTSKSETQTYSQTFTTDPDKGFKSPDEIKLSKVDHKASSKLEKRETVSSEISKGTDRYIKHEEKEQLESEKLSESKMKKESSGETVEREESKMKKIDERGVRKLSIDLKDGEERIDASAKESRIEATKEQLSKKLQDEEGVMTEESGVSKLKESDVDIAVRISQDDEENKVKDTSKESTSSKYKIFEDLGKVEMVTKGESHKETVETFDARHFVPSRKKSDEKLEKKMIETTLEDRQMRAAKEIEARRIIESLMKTVESEIKKRSSLTEKLVAGGDAAAAAARGTIESNYLLKLLNESVETDHEKLADDLTKKFQSIMKKTTTIEEQQSTESTDEIDKLIKLRSILQKDDKRSTSISEDLTKDEESSYRDKGDHVWARLPIKDVTLSSSSISDQIELEEDQLELEETMDVDTNELEDITKPTTFSPQSEKLPSDRSSAQAESLQRESLGPQYDVSLSKDKVLYDVSGARVLEIVEPGIGSSQSRQDSVDVPSLEMDEYKISEDTGKTISSLHESVAVDSLERIAQERDMTFSPSTVSEDINVDYSLVHEQIPITTTEKYDVSCTIKRADSFEIESPPLVSPRFKLKHDLEIKPVNWMIGDEKIEISETLQPSQVFNQELEEYETTIKKQRLSSQSDSADFEQESATKSSDDLSVIESVKESAIGDSATVITITKTKFTVIPVADQDVESELIENKLEVSCQELVDTLKREYEAKTPTEDLSMTTRTSLSLEEAKIKLSEMKIADSSRFDVITSDKEKHETEEDVKSTVAEEQSDIRGKVTVKVEQFEETAEDESLTDEQREKKDDKVTVDEKVTFATEETVESLKEEDVKLLEEIQRQYVAVGITLEEDTQKTEDQVDQAIPKESTETTTCVTKIKISSDDYKRHIEKGFEKRDKAAAAAAAAAAMAGGKVSTVTSSSSSSDTCAFKITKEDLPEVDLSARYAITVLDQVVKKEIAEVKESLEAARQDLIEELSENSETVIQIKDSPSEFQFKLQTESSIPNDLPFLYRPPSLEQITTADKDVTTIKKRDEETSSPSPSPSLLLADEKATIDDSKLYEKEITVTEESGSDDIEFEGSGDEDMDKEKVCMDIEMELDKSETETLSAVHEESKEDDDTRPSPVPASRSCSDVEYKDESSSSLHPPQPAVPRRRHKPARASKKIVSESEVDPGSSSGESSNYQSCDYEIGSGSRPSSSDVEALQSATMPPSGTTSEYETAMMSAEHSTTATSRPTSQEYQTAVSTLSSRESMKSLSSFSSGHLGSIDSTSELSETLVASEADDADKAEQQQQQQDDFEERAFDEEEQHVQSDSSGSDIPIDDAAMDRIDSNIPYRMKRSSEMIFQQIVDDNAALDTDIDEPILEQDTKGIDFATSAFVVTPGAVQSVDIMTARVTEDGIQSVSTQVISTQVIDSSITEIPTDKITDTEIRDTKLSDESIDFLSMEPDSLEPKSGITGTTPEDTAEALAMQTSTHSMMQQASMSTSSTSGLSIDTVVEKAKSERSESPGSDSFELVDKPDIIDDFVVIEEVGREAEEFDSEGKSIRITAIPQVSSKQYDRDLENLITESKEDSQVSTSQASRNNELFDFESEESPPQASNDDQYSQSYSDEEPYETGKKWIEMQFHADARVYDIEYDRGPLEDIKEEEITDFEAGSSRFGSLGSHKESIGSVGSMRGSFGSTPDYDVLAGKKYFAKPSDHDTVSLSSLQEFEHLESAVAAENSKRLQQCGSQDSINNGSLPRRYMTSRSGHGDDISLSSLKDFEGLERACREAHLIELRAREEEDLLEHESPENRYKMESIQQRKSEASAAGSINPSTSGSDDYEKRIKEIDEIIRIAQSNVERLDRQDDTTEDISQIEITDIEKTGSEAVVPILLETEDTQRAKDTNIMETSTDSLELEDNADKKHHPLCQSSDSLEMKTTLDFPSLSSDSLNNVRDTRDAQLDVAEQFSNGRRMSSDSLDVPIIGQPDNDVQEDSNNRSERLPPDNSIGQSSSTDTNIAKQDTSELPSSSKT